MDIKSIIQSRIEYIKKGVEDGDKLAQFELGVRLCKGEGIQKDENAGFSLCLASAEQGYPPAQYQVGVYYKSGLNSIIKQDLKKSEEWISKAKMQGFLEVDPISFRSFYQLFIQGFDAKEEKKLFKKALKSANTGDANAQNEVACRLGLGIGTKKNSDKAFKWFELSNANGFDLQQSKNNVIDLTEYILLGDLE